MKPRIRPYSIGQTLFAGLLIAAAFACLSFFMLVMQARSDDLHHRAGMILSTEDNLIHIQNARGQVTVLVVPDDARLAGVTATDALVVGQHVMTRGTFEEDGTFDVQSLRVLRGKPEG